jgi:hypothetical protein
LAAVPDKDRRKALLSLLAELDAHEVDTPVMVLNVSRLCKSALPGPESQAVSDRMVRGRPSKRRAQDGVIAATAHDEADVLVTDNLKDYWPVSGAVGTGIRVWGWEELVGYLKSL